MELLPFWMESLSPELAKRAQEELGETPETQAEALLELRNMINDDSEFICPENDTFLIRFLRVKKYSAKKAFKALQNYYELKRTDPGLLTDKVRKIMELKNFHLSPLRAPDGGMVILMNIGTLDFGKYTLEEYFSTAFLCLENYAEIEANQICGCHLLFDLKGINLKKMIHLASPTFLAKIVTGVENCWPHRINSMVVINEPFYVSLVYNILYPMFSQKLRKRISFIGNNMSALHKRFTKQVLPKTLGGVLGQEAHNEFLEKTIASQLEIERFKKYSFHRTQIPARNHSTCGVEENTNFTQSKATTKVRS